MGLVDAIHGFVFSFVLPAIWQKGLVSGNVALIVQSGMLSAGFLIDIMSNGIMGISKTCSIGNKADVNECDVLEYLIEDLATGVIGLYLESITDGRGFMDLCRSSEKPIVVLRGGKSRKGAEAAQSHTASLAGNGAVIGGALAQVGMVEAYDFKQILALCNLPIVRERIVSSSDQVQEIAESLGLPVVLKGLLPEEVHKTELEVGAHRNIFA